MTTPPVYSKETMIELPSPDMQLVLLTGTAQSEPKNTQTGRAGGKRATNYEDTIYTPQGCPKSSLGSCSVHVTTLQGSRNQARVDWHLCWCYPAVKSLENFNHRAYHLRRRACMPNTNNRFSLQEPTQLFTLPSRYAQRHV